MNIFECTEITGQVEKAFKKLIPQLDPNDKIPTKEDLEVIIQNKNSVIFLAEEDKIIGTLTLVINQTPSTKKAWIEDVVVDKNYRNQGIAKNLIEHAIDFSKKKGVSALNLTSNPNRKEANNLYQKLGFNVRNTNVYKLNL